MMRYAYIISDDNGNHLVSSCSFDGFPTTQTGPERGSVEWAKDYLVREGIVTPETDIGQLSAQMIAEIVEEWADAQDRYDNHECDDYDY